MNKIHYRALIQFLTLEKEEPQKVHERLVSAYKDDAPSRTTVFFWERQFRLGRKSLEDDERPGRPRTSTSDELSGKVERLVMSDRRFKILDIAAELDVSYGGVFTILHDRLGMTKVCVRWVPGVLTQVQRSLGSMSVGSCWLSMITIQAILLGVWLLFTKPGFITEIQKPSKNRCSGSTLFLLRQSSSARNRLPARSWQPFSGTPRVILIDYRPLPKNTTVL